MNVDDMDFFDPWPVAEGDPETSSRRTSKWRSPQPTVPVRRSLPVPSGAADAPPTAAEEGPWSLDRLHESALGLARGVVARLREAGHEATTINRSERTPRGLELHFRPWAGPVSRRSVEGTLSLELAEDMVIVRSAFGRSADRPEAVERRASADVDASWVEERVLDFVETALAGADSPAAAGPARS